MTHYRERMTQHGRTPVLFNEGERPMLYVLWLVITPTLMAVANYYGFCKAMGLAIAEYEIAAAERRELRKKLTQRITNV